MNSSPRTGLLVAAAIGCVLTACSRTEPAFTRARLFGVAGDDPVQQALGDPARAVALYWPEPGCFGCQAPARSAVEAAASKDGALRILTIVPERTAGSPSALDLPGEVVELSPSAYARQVADLPTPRIEVWGDAGRELLLLRRLPPVLEPAALAEEIRSCLSFSSSTKPIQEEDS